MTKRLLELPKYLHKPADAIDLYKRYSKTIAAAATETVIDRTNTADRHVEIIPLIINENMFSSIQYFYYKNDAELFTWYTSAQGFSSIMEGYKLSDYMLRNPIRLKPGDNLRVDVKNLGASPVGIALNISGWSYFDDDEVMEEVPPEAEPEGEEVEVET